MSLLTALTGRWFVLPGIPHDHRASLILLHMLYHVYHRKMEMLMCRSNVKQIQEAVLKRKDLWAHKDILCCFWLLVSIDL